MKTLSSHKLFSSPSGLSVSVSLRVGCDAAGSDWKLENVADVHSSDDSKLLCDQRYKLLHFEKAVVSSVSTCTTAKAATMNANPQPATPITIIIVFHFWIMT